MKAIRSDKDRAKGAFSAAGRNGSGKAKASVLFSLLYSIRFQTRPVLTLLCLFFLSIFFSVSSVADMPIDPNEELYCYCQQVSYGEMVACDNDDVGILILPPPTEILVLIY